MQTLSAKGETFPVMKFIVGVTMLFAGGLYTLESLDLLNPDSLRKLWPALLILLGVAMEADAIRRGRFGCGIVLIGVGTWLFAGSYHLFGLSFQTALPLAGVMAGVGLLVDSAMEARGGRAKENHDRQRS